MPIAYYRCKKCHASFDQRDDAARCEQSHLAVKSAKIKHYMHDPFPYSVTVTFSDGRTKDFMRDYGS